MTDINKPIGKKIYDAVVSFISTPKDPRPLGFFRIGVCLVGIVQMLILFPNLLQLYGNYGFIQWAIIETETDTWLPSIGKLCTLFHSLGISSASCVYIVFAIYFTSLLILLTGWKARVFALIAWISHSIMVNSGYISLYGVDTMLHICLFYSMWMPIGESYNLVSYFRKALPSPSSFMAGISFRTLQIHLCIIYLNTAIAKISGTQWWDGEAIWRALMEPQFAVFDFSWLAFYPLLAKIICWGTLIVEGGYVFFIWYSKTRFIWLMAIILMHMGIAIFMGLWLFAIIMIIMNITAFGAVYIWNEE